MAKSVVGNFIRLIRVRHWTKNAFVFTPLIFSQAFLEVRSVAVALAVFGAFCLASSAVYVINDISDREQDAKHPDKKLRPITSGKVSLPAAFVIMVLLVGLACLISLSLNLDTLLIVCSYLLLNILYSAGLKKIVILDVMIIAGGFILRVVAGAVAIGVAASGWILLTTLFISLFLGFGKRRKEMLQVEESSQSRHVLDSYSVELLNYLIVISVTLTIIAYSLYVIDLRTAGKSWGDYMAITVPIVVFGVFRYLYLIYRRGEGGDPADLVLKDSGLIVTILLWGILVVGLICFLG